MDETHRNNDEQSKLWNGRGGRGWVEAGDVLDEMLRPFEERLVEAVSVGPDSHLLDVGCGTGGTTLAISRAIGKKGGGSSLGIDISEPMVAVARERARHEGSPANFICADAQFHAFEPASFDRIVSRFGVMFFADPVQAFSNLRQRTRNGGKLWFVAWRSAGENPFMTAPERAAAPFLPDIAPRQPDAPGPFAFADKDRVHRILAESDWNEIDIVPVDVSCSLPEKNLVRYLTWVGPVGRLLQKADDPTLTKVLAAARSAVHAFVHGTEVRFDARCWMASARA